ncbi:putative transposase-like protein like [Argiope bruennichi]|uniref:Putative transposase-like protein like n=1 Tax=Argiope bruennichi TaxID=94029 RepID=A0A8T0FQ62_ARGBR|nr:putative transposase-like protein like [Argiope bruennichi]
MGRESIVNDLNVSARTVTDWMNFCRGVCEDACLVFDGKIGGVGKIVEIDESKFGKRKFNRGKGVEGKWVFGVIVRYTNDCFFEVVPERTADVLLEIIKRRILPGNTIISDYWSSYKCLENEGFQHLKVNHSLTFEDLETGAHTNSIEGTWGAIKRYLHGTNHIGEPPQFEPQPDVFWGATQYQTP